MKIVNYFNEVGPSQVMGMNTFAEGPVTGEFLGLIKNNKQGYNIYILVLYYDK